MDQTHEDLLNKLKRGEVEIEINPVLNQVPFIEHVRIKRFIRTLQSSTVYRRDNGETWMKLGNNLAVKVNIGNPVIYCQGYAEDYDQRELVTPLEYGN